MNRGRGWMVVSAALLVGAAGVIAQGPEGFGGRGFGFGGPGFGGARHVVTGKPYTAAFTSSSVEKLADGTTITHTSTLTEARDADGRTVRAVTTTGGAGSAVTRTNLMDPVAHTVTDWTTGSTVAVQFQTPANPPNGRGHWDGQGGPNGPGPGAGGAGDGRVRPQMTRVVLSPKTIAGDNATGVKTTLTTPAGAQGNDKPLVSTREVWTSSDLGIVLMEDSENPRDGSHKLEVTSLNAGTPDPTLFQIPANYTVKTETRHRGM